MSLSFQSILLCGQATNEGGLAITPDAVVWTSRSGDQRRAVDLRRVKAAQWVDAGRSCQLWLRDGVDGELHRFEGFKVTDYERVAEALAASAAAGSAVKGAAAGALKLEKLRLGLNGRNWGTWQVSGKTLEWRETEEGADGSSSGSAAGRLIAAVPLAAVSQAAHPGKGEVEVQFFDEDVVEREDEVCVEMRLYVPPGAHLPDAAKAAEAAKRRAAEKVERYGAGVEDEEDEEAGKAAAIEAAGADPAAQLHALVTDAAGVAGVAGDAIAELDEGVGQFLVPRGRYAIEMYGSFARLVGKTYEFKVAYKSIARMFYLPKPTATGEGEASRYFFVISLDDPLRHGAQRHPHLVLQLDRREISVPLNVSDEDIRAGRFEGLGKESKVVEGDLPRTVASLFKHITSKPIFKPGNFLSAARSKAVRCTLKGNDGLLYPLEKSLLFVHKPATWLRYSDIESLEFRRSTGSSRSWELAVHVKSGTAAAGISAGELALQALDKGEWEPLRAYFSERGVRVTEAAHGGGDIRDAMAGGEEEDEEDEDEEADGEVGRKRKRRAAAAGAGAGAGDEEEDSDEDDESYHGEGGSDDDDEDADAGSGSDDDDDAAGSEDEDEGFSKKKQPKKPAAKKAPAKKGKAASSKKGDEGGKGSKKAPAKKKPAKKRARRDSEDDDEDGGDSDE